MDSAPRQAFLAAVVAPAERTAIMGFVNSIKTAFQSLGPITTGFLAEERKFWIAFVVAGLLKASYDLGMLAVFRGHKTYEDLAAKKAMDNLHDETRDGGEIELVSQPSRKGTTQVEPSILKS